MQTNVIRRIDVRATTSGVDESRQKLVQFGAAQSDAASSAGELERAMQKTQRAMELNARMYQQGVDAQRAAAAANDNFAQSNSAVGAALRMATKAAVDQGTGYLIAAGKATAFAFAAAAVATILGGLFLIYKTLATAIGLVTDAWELSGKALAEHAKIARDAVALDLSTDYFQRITKAAADSKVPVDAVTDAIKKLNEAAVEKLGGSTLQKSLADHLEAGNFRGNTGATSLLAANNGEERFKAIVALLDQAVQKGERLAAMDLLGKTMGPAAAEAFRKNADYFRNIEESAAAIAAKDLVPDADVARALDLERRFGAAAEILSQRWHPLQGLLTELGIKMREAWVGIVEQIAFAVDGAAKLASKIADIPQSFWDYVKGGLNAAGNALTAATTTSADRKAAETAYGISSDPADMAALEAEKQRAVAVDQLRVKLLTLNAVERASIETQTVYGAVRKDTSKTLDKEIAQTGLAKDALDRAMEALEKYIQTTSAAARTVDAGVYAQEKAKAIAQLTAAAMRDGKTDLAQYADAWGKLGDRAGKAAQDLRLAQATSRVKFDSDTLLMSPGDKNIASTMRDLYGDSWQSHMDDALAKQMRMNELLRDVHGTAQDFARDLVQGLMSGQSAMQALGQAATNLSGKLADKAIVSLLSGDFAGAAVAGIGSLISGVFGNAQKKRDQQAQDAKATAERMESYAQRAQLARIDTATQAGALQAFDIQAQKQRLDEQRAGGKGMAALEQALAEERLAIIDRFNKDAAAAEEAARKAALQRTAAYQDRIFAAANDNATLDGALAEYNRKAMQEQAAEIEAGGQAINDLVAAQEAERLGIYKKFNDAAIAAAKAASDELTKIYKSIKDYLQGLETGASSILSPQAQLQAAAQNFTSNLALAQGGDRDAINGLTQVAQTYLDQAKSFYASSQGYADIYNQVSAALAGLAANMPTTLTDSDKIVAAVEKTTTAVNITGAQADALAAAQNALAAQQVVYLQTQNALLSAINSLADRFVAAINGLGSLTAGIAGQEINLLAQIAKGSGQTFWNWLGFEKGGVIPGYAAGGVVGNGIYGRDSVLARYAGGGTIGLAGGEYVMPADQTQMFRSQLDAMRNGTFAPSNDNGSREIGTAINRQTEILAARFDAMASELAALRADNKSLNSKLSLVLAAA